MNDRPCGFSRAFWAAAAVGCVLALPAVLIAPSDGAWLVLYVAIGIGIVGAIDLRRP